MSRQNDKVLSWLKRNKELTTRQAVTELYIMSLSRSITELRREGHNITMEYRKSQDGARYGVYRLEEVRA